MRAGQFTPFSKFLHWTMAAMVLSMLGIGLSMVVSLHHYGTLVAIHRPLGILILLFVVVRIVNRLTHRAPPLPPTVPPPERVVALASELAMYGLMVLMPLVGWGMLSAAGNPIVMWGPVHLPPILPRSPTLYAGLRRAHTVLAYAFLFTFFGHLTAVLFHTLVVRDGLLWRMVPRRASVGQGVGPT